MKQQNIWQRCVAPCLLALALVALALIPLKNRLMPRVAHTFVFDNRNHHFKIKRLAVVGDFSDWQERYYLNDADHDGRWRVTVPLKIGWHSYRFLINGKRWVRDWSVPDYGGPYSNSQIYVDTLIVPKWHGSVPATGSWLYRNADTLRFVFDSDIKNWLRKNRAEAELDSILRPYIVSDSVLKIPLPPLADGEHDWTVRLRKRDGTVVMHRFGIFFLNRHNHPPIANAGHTQIVYLGQAALLDGGLSFDPDFEPITRFSWRQTAGPEKIKRFVRNKPLVRLTFNTPGRYRFVLTVRDSMGLQNADETQVLVLPERSPVQIFSVAADRFKVPVKTMALVGEFNRWNASANPMHYDSVSGQWSAALALPSGQWEYKFVVNDSLWLPDPTNPHKVSDGWNGFNSLRIIPHDSTFDGTFSEIENTGKRLVVAFNPLRSAGQSFRWIGDVQNPAKKFRGKGNRLYFDKSAPQGTYFYYLIQSSGGHFSRPRILFINHYQKTAWYDFQQTPAWADTSVIYELFLRRFTRLGTFKSLTAKLPYLKKLGVNTIWMLPVYQGPTEHGYAPTSLFQTDKRYGSLTDYAQLINKAHQMGMNVLFDFVANHLSDQHRFVRAAYFNKRSPLRDWFYWKPDGTWGYHNDWDTLVNLNYHNPWVRHYMIQAAQFWLSSGTDGFRCDVAWAVPHSFWKDFRRSIKPLKFDCLLLDEVLPRQPIFHDNQFDMSYDTDFYGNVLDVLHHRKPISAIPLGLAKSRLNYPKGAQSLRYLENHDLPRFISQFGPQLTKVMAVVLFTVPGTPLLYYGQEYGAQEIRPNFYALNNAKWFDFYQKLIKFRKSSKALTIGTLQTVKIDDSKRLWWYRRQWRNQTVDVIINLSDSAQIIKEAPQGKIKKIDGSKFKRTGKRTIKIEGNSFIIIQKDEGK